jgi:phenylalanine-4-hydroxylase
LLSILLHGREFALEILPLKPDRNSPMLAPRMKSVVPSSTYDLAYVQRRQSIIDLADQYRRNPTEIPLVNYTTEEDATWRTVLRGLRPLHKEYASIIYLDGFKKLRFSSRAIPELREVNEQLKRACNFKLVPVEGLVDAKIFLGNLEQRTMLCTQYVRHPSQPFYSPEPDIIHEIIGHTPLFTSREMVRIYKLIGQLANRADGDELLAVERLAWFTMEAGLIRENGKVKVLGTALLSSMKELRRSVSSKVEKIPFSIKEVVNTPFQTHQMQPKLFVIPTLRFLRKEIQQYFGCGPH